MAEMVKAKLWNGYLIRMLLLAGMTTAFSGWFLYDGFVGYPGKQRIFQAFEEYQREGDVDGVTAVQRWNRDRQDRTSEIYGFPRSPEGQNPASKVDDKDILTQKLIGFGLLPFALASIAWVVVHLGRWVGLTDDALMISSGQKAPINAIRKLDKTRWFKKGIAVVTYMDPEQQIEQQITLDDWKYDRYTTRAILKAIEDQLSDEQIIGEREPEATDPDDGDAATLDEAKSGDAVSSSPEPTAGNAPDASDTSAPGDEETRPSDKA
ncbi:MAG: hypothetical protein JJU36_08265 [Phycisphaeraceae bacterium]|nr:hypothetical protein [Phycisphaeraceae bacterium]